MIDAWKDVSVLAVAVAAFASFVLGGLWFTVFFPKPYKLALGKENAPNEKPAPIFIVGPFLCGVVTTATSALLLRSLNITSYDGALLFGAVVGFGYLVANTVNVAINPNIPRPLVYGLVSGSYFFVANLVVSVILVAMQ